MTSQNDMAKIRWARKEIRREYHAALGYARRYGQGWDRARMWYARFRLYEEALAKAGRHELLAAS